MKQTLLLLITLSSTLSACSDGKASADHGGARDLSSDMPATDKMLSRDSLGGEGATSDGQRDLPQGESGSADSRPADQLVQDAGLPTSCAGGCAIQALTATFGAVTEPIAHTMYGVDKDQHGQPGVYLEAWHGGAAGCRSAASPQPDRSLIISGLPLPRSGPPLSLADGLVVSLIDNKETLITTGLKVAKATAAEISFTAARVCPSCVGQSPPADPDGFVALEIKATFHDGTVKGHLYAIHCDTLDL